LAFGDLRVPRGAGRFPVAVIVHGGCWRSQYDLVHLGSLAAALGDAGIATWSLEFRRIGDAGGGWPGTFDDVAQGADHLRTLARECPLDLERVVLVGHSAGGHLALWLAARKKLPAESPIRSANPLAVRGVVALAGIADVRGYGSLPGFCNDSVELLLGGSPKKVPERYAQANPFELLPFGVPLRLVHGALDTIVRLEQSQRFVAEARAKGDDARAVVIDAAGHFDLIAPFSPAWPTVEKTVLALVGR
jgi:acetyl esterase/lipase